jgi:hypothetical protein
MNGLRASGNLGDLLKPIEAFLDGCWWCLGGSGAKWLGTTYPGNAASEAEVTRWREKCRRAAEEYSLWVDDALPNYRVGIPGFFSRYGNAIETDWQIYYASDAAELPVNSFDETLGKRIGWFEAPPELPADICLLVRDIDNAYWDLFFRDEWAYDAVKGHLGGRAKEFVDASRVEGRRKGKRSAE